MKKLAVLFVLFCVITSIAQGKKQNVAVYMAGEEPAGAKGVHKVLGAELAKAITASKTYSAIDRTEEIQKQIAKEHTYQRSGMVNDTQIKELGKQLGAQYMCIAEVTQVGKSFYLEVKLVDVETAKVIKVASMDGDLKNAGEMIKTAQKVTHELLPREVVVVVDSAHFYRSKGREYSQKLWSEHSDANQKNIENWNNAITNFTHAIRLNPKTAEYYIDRGSEYRRGHIIYYFTDSVNDAIADYTKAIQLKPKNAEYYVERGNTYRMNRNLGRAIDDYKSALQVDPNHADAKESFEDTQKDLQEYRNRVSEYTGKIQQKPNDGSNFSDRGYAYYNIGEYDKAIADYTKAIQLRSDYAHYYSFRGLSFLAKKDYAKAISDLEAAARLDPSNSSIKKNLERIRDYQKYSQRRK
jgi:tetratricopeptide (TPR) repeat protein